MSVFTKPRLARIFTPNNLLRSTYRCIITNPAENSNPAFRNPALVPFGINFLEDDLRNKLESRGIDCDSLEQLYYHQCQNDMEFNAPRLPRSSDSKLWGFIYGQRLISASYQFNTIREDEKYLINYLNETIKELTMRMNRFYPNFDYKSQINAYKKSQDSELECDAYNNAYNEALAEIISSNPNKFIQIFKNNGFIPPNNCESESDSDDKYNDYLPESIETELISQYKYNWDFNSNLNIGFNGYFERINKLEQILAPKMDSLSKNLRKNFADFLLNKFNANALDDIKYVINMVENSTNIVINGDLNESNVNSDILVKNCIELLDEMSGSGILLSKLFYGNVNCELELNNLSSDELYEKLCNGVDNERLILINKSLQIYEYLKYNSITSLILVCLINKYNEYFGQFLNDNSGDENINKFNENNNEIFDKIISYLNIYYENQEDLYMAYNNLYKSININGFECNLNEFKSPTCYINDILMKNYEIAIENGNIVDQIKYLTYQKYIAINGGNDSGIALIKSLLNGGKNGNISLTGDEMNKIAYHFSTDSSGGNDILCQQILDYCKNNALKLINKNDLLTGIQSELDNFRNISIKYNESRENLENEIKNVCFDFKNINFDYAKTNYDPLSMYLSRFKYYAAK